MRGMPANQPLLSPRAFFYFARLAFLFGCAIGFLRQDESLDSPTSLESA
jgi:hypothetical protein